MNIRLGIIIMLLFVAGNNYAQVNPSSTKKISQWYPKVSLKTPVKNRVRYDSLLKKFIVTEKVGDYHVSTPKFLSLSSYEDYLINQDIKKYYTAKQSVLDGFKKASKKYRKNLLPTYYVNNNFFKSIFGSGDIVVDAKANINFRLGVIYQEVNNPNVSVDNQRNFIADFNQKIAASLNAKIGERIRVSANYDTQATFDFQNIFKVSFVPESLPIPTSLLNLDKDKLLDAGKDLLNKKIKQEIPVDLSEGERSLEELSKKTDIFDEVLDIGSKDDILQGLDVGNVSMDMSNRLIAGARNLFGVKTKMVFGNTTINTVFFATTLQS